MSLKGLKCLKDLNFKQMLLEKGEKLILWGAVAVMLGLVGYGLVVNGFLGNSASATTEDLVALKTKGDTALNNSRPPEGVFVVPAELLKAGDLKQLSPSEFPCANDFFILLSLDDRKWRKPEVLLPSPEDFQIDLMKTQVRSFWFGKKGDQLAIMYLLDKTKRERNNQNTLGSRPPQFNRNVFQRTTLPRGNFPGMGGPPGGGMPGGMPPGGPGGAMPGAAPVGPGAAAAAGGDDKADIATVMIPVDKLAKDDKVEGRPAEYTYPCRMVVVQGAFPYKKQIELFRRSLRFESIEQMEKEAAFEFTSINVQRRVTSPNGKPGDWKDLDVKNSVRSMLLFGTEPEDEKLLNYGLVWKKDRLVIPRPMLAREQKYPEPNIKSIQDTIAAMEKASSEAAPPPLIQAKSKYDSGLDIYEIEDNKGGGGGANVVPGAKPMNPGAPAGANTGGFKIVASVERLIPEKSLIRFLDVTVQPGFTYEYRVQVEMANPLHGKTDKSISQELTKEKFITSDWAAIPHKLFVPYETEYFAVEEFPQRSRGTLVKPDQTWVQVHRWLDWVPVNPTQPRESLTPVGEWSIADQVLATRGEYIGRWEETKVPVWMPKQDCFVLAQPPESFKKKRLVQHKGIPVDFNTGALLVDFNGGKQSVPVKRDGKDLTIREDGALEMLVLTPDGKLLVRNGREDTENKARQERLKNWTEWVKAVESGDNKGTKKKGDDFFEKK